MSGFSAIDLSRLPPSEIIETVSYEALLEDMTLSVIADYPEIEPTIRLESEPARKVLRACAYYRMLDRLEFNDHARGLMLAKATGGTLDQLAAFWGVERLIMQEGDDSVTPPIPQVKESDEAFRRRVQLSLEGHTTAGPRGSYLFWALSASGEIKDASVQSPAPGDVLVTVLAHNADGAPSNSLLNAVETALNAEDVRPLCDTVIVQGASILTYQVEAILTLYNGPGEAEVLAAAKAALTGYISDHHRLGHDITRSGIYAALHQPGVQNVTMTQPAADIEVGLAEAAFCAADAVMVSVGGRDV